MKLFRNAKIIVDKAKWDVICMIFNKKNIMMNETVLFAQLKDKELFGAIRVIFDTIEWNNRLDIDPEVL